MWRATAREREWNNWAEGNRQTEKERAEPWTVFNPESEPRRERERPRQGKLFFFFNTRNTGALKAICLRTEPLEEETDGKVREFRHDEETVSAPEHRSEKKKKKRKKESNERT